MRRITFIREVTVGNVVFLRFKLDDWMQNNSENRDYLTLSTRSVMVKGDLELKPNQRYEILAYKICHNENVLVGGECILGGHSQGGIDWIVTGMMENFIRHQRYYLMRIHIEEVKNDR